MPYKFKKTYGGTPEPQTAQGAPWLRGPSLKIALDMNFTGIIEGTHLKVHLGQAWRIEFSYGNIAMLFTPS